jgi:hypothetical protein
MALFRCRLLAPAALAGAALLTGVPAVASAATPDGQAALSAQWRTECMLDGFVIGSLPADLGELRTDFEYQWEAVTFHSRVWETGPDSDGGYRVDLTIKTMRASTFTDLDGVRSFLFDYYEHDPESWRLTRVKVGPYDGYRSDDEVFWFVDNGVAASVRIDRNRFSGADLLSTARGFRPAGAVRRR